MEAIRVLQYVNVLDRGGVESFIFSNLECFDRSRVTFDFLLTRVKAEPREDDLCRLACEKITLPIEGAGKWQKYIATYRATYRLFKQGKYRIVHFQSNPPGVMATASVLAAKRAGVPCRILHSHGAGGNEASYGAARPLITWLCRAVNAACCNHFIAPSLAAARYGFSNSIIKNERYKIIRNAVDVERYAFSTEERARYRKQLGLSDRLVVGHIGRFSAVKNHSFMLDVLCALRMRGCDADLLLVGGDVEAEPDIRPMLMAKAARLGISDHIIFYGESADIPGLLSCMDIFLFPSASEALGIAAVEAQLSGLPVLAAEDGIPGEMDITGNVTWRSLRQTPEEWAIAMEKMEKPRYRNIDMRTPEIDAYNVKKTAETLEKYYLDLHRMYEAHGGRRDKMRGNT